MRNRRWIEVYLISPHKRSSALAFAWAPHIEIHFHCASQQTRRIKPGSISVCSIVAKPIFDLTLKHIVIVHLLREQRPVDIIICSSVPADGCFAPIHSIYTVYCMHIEHYCLIVAAGHNGSSIESITVVNGNLCSILYASYIWENLVLLRKWRDDRVFIFILMCIIDITELM